MKKKLDASALQRLRESFAPAWTLEDDNRLWSQIGGYSGLLELKKQACDLVSLCAGLTSHGSDRRFMRYRSRLITVCIALSFVECTIRLVCAELPHFFGRFVVEIFCEMMGRAELVVEEKAPELLGLRGEIYDQANYPDPHGEVARGTASGASW